MNDTTIGFLILGAGIVLVLALVFAITLRTRPAGARPQPPRGVHLPSPSPLPVILSLGAALIAAGLSFRPQDPWPLPVLDAVSTFMHPVIGPLGIVVLVYGIFRWVRDANHEWREVEHGSHDASGH